MKNLALSLSITLAGCAHHAAKPQVVAAKPVAKPAATVDGKPITVEDLDAHQKESGLDRAAALDDLVDLRLLIAVAQQKDLALDTTLGKADARAKLELQVATALQVDVPPVTHELVVDHAWVQDTTGAKQKKQRKDLEKLRALVEAGDTIPVAFGKLKLDGAAWHIGDHETYPYAIIPADAHDLPAGSLSPIIPGDGGLHLLHIYEHKRTPPPVAVVREALRPRLREGHAIAE